MIKKTIKFSEMLSVGDLKNNKECYHFGIRVNLFLRK